MNINKVDYATVIEFGDLESFLKKLQLENVFLNEIINQVDRDGISLLEKALMSRKFDIAKYLLDHDAKVNVISKERRNEWHYLAANINIAGATEIAKALGARNVDLSLQDLHYGNTALFSLCIEALKQRKQETIELLVDFIRNSKCVNTMNKAGISTRDLITQRGTEEMKKALEGNV